MNKYSFKDMSKFLDIYRKAVCESTLKRVRVTYLNNYEGYILEEDDDGNAVVFVTSPDGDEQDIMNVNAGDYQELSSGNYSSLEEIKMGALVYLKQKGLIDCGSANEIQDLLSAPCVHSLENTLRSLGLHDTEILDIIKIGV